jgi:hypothetical protein
MELTDPVRDCAAQILCANRISGFRPIQTNDKKVISVEERVLAYPYEKNRTVTRSGEIRNGIFDTVQR